mmetsp:Transcript_11377/g.47580  ORF Transcript_11377/g.47580 Transcript_11377/m.47580 type:complete len:244 (-) Transcript_11377:478-1209(-)
MPLHCRHVLLLAALEQSQLFRVLADVVVGHSLSAPRCNRRAIVGPGSVLASRKGAEVLIALSEELSDASLPASRRRPPGDAPPRAGPAAEPLRLPAELHDGLFATQTVELLHCFVVVAWRKVQHLDGCIARPQAQARPVEDSRGRLLARKRSEVQLPPMCPQMRLPAPGGLVDGHAAVPAAVLLAAATTRLGCVVWRGERRRGGEGLRLRAPWGSAAPRGGLPQTGLLGRGGGRDCAPVGWRV